jgi:hypothetical protein
MPFSAGPSTTEIEHQTRIWGSGVRISSGAPGKLIKTLDFSPDAILCNEIRSARIGIKKVATAAEARPAAIRPPPPSQSNELFLGEEELSDVSLATFYVFDKESAGAPPLAQQLRLAAGGCGGGGAVEVAAEVWRRRR